MSSLDDCLVYVQHYRAEFDDATIRESLLKQGFDAAAVDGAFQAAGARPSPAAAPAAAPPQARPAVVAAKASRFPLKAVAAAGLAAVVLGGGGFAAFKARAKKGAPAQAPAEAPAPELPPEVANYAPEPLADPVHLAAFQPAGLREADAAPAWKSLISAHLGALSQNQAVPAGTVEAFVDSDMSANSMRFLGNVYVPSSLTDLLMALAGSVQSVVAVRGVLQQRAKNCEASADWACAQRAAQSKIHFGWLMMQDWAMVTQMLGVTVAIEGVLQHQSLRRKELGAAPPERLDAVRLVLELKAYAPDPVELRSADACASDRAAFARFERYLGSERLARAYLANALFSAAAKWSPEEARAGEPWPERLRFLQAAAASPDARVAALGRGYGAILQEIRADLLKQQIDGRIERIQKLRGRIDAMMKAG